MIWIGAIVCVNAHHAELLQGSRQGVPSTHHEAFAISCQTSMSSSSSMRSAGAFAICLVAVVGFSGCGRSRVEVTQGENTIGLRDTVNQDTIMAGENVTIPDTFPADIPRYPQATVTLVTRDIQQQAHTVTQETSDDVATAKARIDAEMTGAGFKKTNDIGDASVAIVSYEKADIRFQFQIARDDRKNATRILAVRAQVTEAPTP